MKTKTIMIDGSQGEGGGQILRTSLSLAMCFGQPVVIDNIRAGRQKPGLLRQHLACVRAAKAITEAEVVGDEIGSRRVEFKPGAIEAGEYEFGIGSAGSTLLVFQTVLPALHRAQGFSTLKLQGGTHNGMAPSYDFVIESFVPALKLMGYELSAEIERYGFYPAGCGEWSAVIKPVGELYKLNLTEQGKTKRREAVVTTAKLPSHVAQREIREIQKRCGLNPADVMAIEVDSVGPGNIVSMRLQFATHTALFESVGAVKVPAEKVAKKAVVAMQAFKNSGAAVDEYLADQLILPMVLGKGGCFTTTKPSQHLLTNIEVVKQMTGITTDIKQVDANIYEISINV